MTNLMCSRCKQLKSADSFGVCRANVKRIGKSGWCIQCHKEALNSPESIARREKRLAETKRFMKTPFPKHANGTRMWDGSAVWEPSGMCTVQDIVKTNDAEIPYVAGFIDAEGTFTVFTNECKKKICVYNDDRSILEFVASKIGGSIYSHDRRGATEYQLSIHSKDGIKRACDLLIPYLIIKRKQASILSDLICGGVDKHDARRQISNLNQNGLSNEIYPDIPSVKYDQIDATTSEWAYFAGYVDGDGTIRINRLTVSGIEYGYPQMYLYSIKPESLLWIQKIFGGKFDSRQRDEKCARMYELSFEDQQYIPRILSGLMPYLISKKEKARIVLNSCAKPSTERIPEFYQLKEMNKKLRSGRGKTKTEDSPMAAVFSTLNDYISKENVEFVIVGETKTNFDLGEARTCSLGEYAAMAG